MIFDSIPDYLKEQAKIYYGITEFPPEAKTCAWKLVCGCRKNQKERSFLIQNGQHAAIYMVALDTSWDGLSFEESHLTRPDIQILFADIEERLIFGRFDKYLYKLIPNIYLNDDDTEVNSFSAKVYINDNTKHLQREREKLAEIAKGRLVAASLDKDQTKNIVYPVFHVITSYMKHFLYTEYVIQFNSTSDWFCQGEWLPSGLDISNYVYSHTLEQCYEWVTQPNRQYNDLWKSQIFYGVWTHWYWGKTGRSSYGWVGARANLTIEARLKEGKQYAVKEGLRRQFFIIEQGASWISRRGEYLNTHMQGYNIRFNDFDYKEKNVYDGILSDLGLIEPPPFQEDENQEQPLDTSLIPTRSSGDSNSQTKLIPTRSSGDSNSQTNYESGRGEDD